MTSFNRLSRGTIFQTGESVSYSMKHLQEGMLVEQLTFIKLSATVAVPFEEGRTRPSVQYIPHFRQKCEVLGHVTDGLRG